MPITPIGVPEAKAVETAHKPQAAQSPQHNRTFWHELIERVAAAAGVDPELAMRVAAQESGLSPDALNPVSGAIGIMQLMPSTAAALGVDPRNSVQNVIGGVQYLREQLSHFRDEAKALAAYNWGPGRVEEAVERWGAEWLSHAPRETQHYIASILSRSGLGLSLAAQKSEASPASRPSPSASVESASQSAGTNSALAGEVASLREALSAYLLAAILD